MTKDIFEEELKRRKIFLKVNVLSPHYVPEELPHREQEVKEITRIIAPVLRNEKPDNIFIYGKTGTGKCVSGDTSIFLGDGRIIEIEKIFDEVSKEKNAIKLTEGEEIIEMRDVKLGLLALDVKTMKLKLAYPKYFFRQKVSKTLKLKTKSGREIEVTPEHPFYVLDNKLLLKKAKEIRPHDYVMIPKKLKAYPTFNYDGARLEFQYSSYCKPIKTPEISNPFGEWLGFLISEGTEYSYRKNKRFIFTNSDRERLERFRILTQELFELNGHFYHPGDRTPSINFESKSLAEYLKRLGYKFGRKSREKRIPDIILKSPNEVVAQFLRTFFDCEAHVSTKNPEIELCLASKKLINQLMYLLLRFGIVARVFQRRKYATNTKEKVKRKYYLLRISGSNSLKKFYTKIGFTDVKKNKNLEKHLLKEENTNVQIVPKIGKLLDSIRIKLEISGSLMDKTRQSYYAYAKEKRYPSKEKLANFCKIFDSRLREYQKLKGKYGVELVKDALSLGLVNLKSLSIQYDLSPDVVRWHFRNNSTRIKEFSKLFEPIVKKKIDSLINDKNLQDKILFLRNLINSDVEWDKVSEIKTIEKPQYVYDFTIPKYETFIAGYGGMISHNTCVVKYVLRKLNEFVNDPKKNINNALVRSIYMNCKIRNSKYQVLLNMLEDEALNSSPLGNTPLEDRTDNTLTGIDPANLYDRLYKVVEKNSLNLILVLDEIDMISKGLNDLIYILTRINDELKEGHVSLVGMSNDIRVMRRLDPRTKSTLCQEERIFKPYNAPELETILTQRINAGFLPGTISKDVISRIAAFAAQDGDARYALRLLKKSGELAEESGKDRITMEEAEKAKSAVEEDIMAEAISTLPEHQQIVIYSIASLALKGGMYKRLSGISGGGGDLFTGEVYEAYEENCKLLNRQPRTSRQFSEYLNELEMLGLITMTISGKGIRGTTRLMRLGYDPDEIKTIVKKGLGLE